MPGERLIMLSRLPYTGETNFPAMPRNPGSLLTRLLFVRLISLTLVLMRKTYCFHLLQQLFEVGGSQERGGISTQQPALRSGVSSIGSAGQLPFRFPGQLYREMGCSTSVVITRAKAIKYPLKRRSAESSVKSRRFPWRIEQNTEIKG